MKDNRIYSRVTSQQKKILEEIAKKKGLSISSLIRYGLYPILENEGKILEYLNSMEE